MVALQVRASDPEETENLLEYAALLSFHMRRPRPWFSQCKRKDLLVPRELRLYTSNGIAVEVIAMSPVFCLSKTSHRPSPVLESIGI